jgi:Na+-translocating ferredoxin:NAD+ oxidoreductase subunit D
MTSQPSVENPKDLVVNSAPHITGTMSKNRLMLYTFVALAVLVAIAAIPFGYTPIIVALIAVGVAVGIDFLFSKIVSDSQLNLMSAAVFGMIVACSYTLGLPGMGFDATYSANITMQGAGLYYFPALISAVGMVVFKKVQGIAGRKFVNPAAAAKLAVLVFLFPVALLPAEHTSMFPSLTSSLAVNSGNPLPFGLALQQCFGNNFAAFAGTTMKTISQSDVLQTLVLMKYHGWMGGVSSIAVIAVGIALFVLCRGYIKWKITASYLVTVAVAALALSFVYADSDPILRIAFHLFIGSSIFLAFFMATDPATTPFTGIGQLIFGVGLGVLTVLIQTYMGFFGGSILALIIMNLTVPLLDRVGIHKSFGR